MININIIFFKIFQMLKFGMKKTMAHMQLGFRVIKKDERIILINVNLYLEAYSPICYLVLPFKGTFDDTKLIYTILRIPFWR